MEIRWKVTCQRDQEGRRIMGKEDKLIDRLLKKPKDVTFDEMESLLSYKNYNGTVQYSCLCD